MPSILPFFATMMQSSTSTPLVTSGLGLFLDAGNSASYTGSGTSWNDISGSGNVLTLFGSPTFNSGGGYFTFNGSSQYARTSTLPSDRRINFSMCAILRPSNLNQIAYAIQNGRDDAVNPPYTGYGFGVGNGAGSAGSKFQGLASNVTFIDTGYTFPSTSNWYFLVMTRDTATLRFYVNAVQTTNTSAAGIAMPETYFTVGAGFGNVAGRHFAGDIGVVLYYNKQLTDAEITQNFNALRGRYGL